MPLFSGIGLIYDAGSGDDMTEKENPAMRQKEIFAARRQKLKKLARQKGLDALLISHPANRFYLSGFELHDPQPNESAGYLVIVAGGRDWLCTDSRYAIAAGKIWDEEQIFIYNADAASALIGLLARCGAIIGIESKSLSSAFVSSLGRGGGGFSPAIVPADGLVEKLRVIKDEAEIGALENSFALNHKMLAHLEQEIGGGKIADCSEQELAWDMERFFRENGAQELAFATIVARGVNAAMPHAVPGTEPIGRNAPLLVDLGCRVDNYCSDQTRTWWLGNSPTAEFSKALTLVRKAQKAAMDIMRPGVPCRDVYAAARKVFEDAGEEKNFTHGLGHGVGLETHEAPSLSPRSAQILEQGMVVTVEPGLYYPQWGGVRWENTVLVTDKGIKVL